MTALSCKPASEYGIAEIAQFVTDSFEGYFVPVVMTEANLLARIRLDSLDLSESRVIIADGSAVGVALIARRGWSSRVAAMGIMPDWRNKGVGKFLMRALLDEARRRGDHEMVLEVIEQNHAAISLYEGMGFERLRRLVGLSADVTAGESVEGLEQIDPRELGRLTAVHGLLDLPWQLSAETIGQFTRPYRAYRLDQAYALISDSDTNDVRFFSLLVETAGRGKGQARRLIRAIVGQHGGRSWHVPAIFPEEITGPFDAAGFQRENLSQWQMRTVIPA